MRGDISKMAKRELVATIRNRYQHYSKRDKGFRTTSLRKPATIASAASGY